MNTAYMSIISKALHRKVCRKKIMDFVLVAYMRTHMATGVLIKTHTRVQKHDCAHVLAIYSCKFRLSLRIYERANAHIRRPTNAARCECGKVYIYT